MLREAYIHTINQCVILYMLYGEIGNFFQPDKAQK